MSVGAIALTFLQRGRQRLAFDDGAFLAAPPQPEVRHLEVHVVDT